MLFREEDCSGEEAERRDHATQLELTDLAVGLEIAYYDRRKSLRSGLRREMTRACYPVACAWR